ncbi:uncharacterized protein HMPREF1541_02177 [Cyphellophora europaea CBS 101466]|uniref:Uncharacterized protein n=1 Tax=Cyphellophora europaea (strain CBS 101466) TaxID=1220924 RepID=W2S4Z4_CYPE1|nr:uncharacterized protein HMPREF1541_02177 [Cyphellophora europaea CBS 101466]ETN43019.1 hypothetical protein HMPREF1541_02177 [Cyphellophora europaea CBS 101466]
MSEKEYYCLECATVQPMSETMKCVIESCAGMLIVPGPAVKFVQREGFVLMNEKEETDKGGFFGGWV